MVNGRLMATDHVSNLDLWILRCHGVPASSLQDVFRATFMLRRSRTVCHRGPVPALRSIAHCWARFSDAVNDKISAQRTCRQSPSCLTMRTRPFSGESSRTLNTYCSRSCLNAFLLATIYGNGLIASPSFPRLSITISGGLGHRSPNHKVGGHHRSWPPK